LRLSMYAWLCFSQEGSVFVSGSCRADAFVSGIPLGTMVHGSRLLLMYAQAWLLHLYNPRQDKTVASTMYRLTPFTFS
jgi:hypothetical protein